MATKKTTSTVTKSAITGRYVSKSTVKRHPRTTVTQTVRKSRKKPASS